jgi:hypothetical protein
MKPLTIVLGLLAAALLFLGLFLGFRPVYDDAGYDCGSAFRENPDLQTSRYVDAMTGGTGDTGCDKERSDALPLPLVLTVLGVASGAAAVTLAASARRRTPAAHEAARP